MAKQRSDDSKYESRHGGGWITPAQFLAEVMCERTAKENLEELPIKFWNKPRWKKEFFKQLNLANTILKDHDAAVVSKALKSKEGKKIFSLGAPWLKKLILLEEKNFKEISSLTESKEAVELPIRKTFQQSKSLIKRIKELDNE
jgi:hypothetical protein